MLMCLLLVATLTSGWVVGQPRRRLVVRHADFGSSALVLRDALERAPVQKYDSGLRWTDFREDDENEEEPPVSVCEPREGPWAVVHFVGGAGLGGFPRAAYGSLVERLVKRTRVAVVCTPYDLTLDHDSAAKATKDAFDRVRSRCIDTESWPSQAPLFGLGHSLGAKLLLLNDDGKELLLMAPNNFGLADSIKALDGFVTQILGAQFGKVNGDSVLGAVLGAVGMYAQASGFDVKPSPAATIEVIKESPARATLLQFAEDALDSSEELGAALAGAKVERLDFGSHLTPVYLRLSVDDAPEEVGTLLGGLDNKAAASFGDDADLDDLVDALANCIVPGSGKKRNRSPKTLLDQPSPKNDDKNASDDEDASSS